MSTHWDVHCRTCDKGLGLSLRSEDDTMRWLIANRLAFEAMAEHLESPKQPGYVDRSLSIAIDYGPRFDPAWFLVHRGHVLAPRDEYGRYSDQCDAWLDCESCGTRRACVLTVHHEGEHRARRPAP